MIKNSEVNIGCQNYFKSCHNDELAEKFTMVLSKMITYLENK